MGEMATYDPSKLMDSVAAKIRAEFAGLIPEEHWRALVKKAVDGFFERRDRGYNQDKTSDFELLVLECVRKDAAQRIAKYLEGPEWVAQWDGAHKTVSEAVDAIVKKNAHEFINAMVGGLVQSLVEEMRSRLTR